MDKSNSNVVQLGSNLLPHKGGIYQACNDYHQALGGSVSSLLSISEKRSDRDDEVDYYETAGNRLGDKLGYLPKAERQRLKENIHNASAVFLHGCFRMSADYTIRYTKSDDIPFCFIPHGGLDPWVFTYGKVAKSMWMMLYGRRLLHEANAVLAMSQNELRKIQRFVGQKNNQHVINLPLNLKVYNISEDRADLRERLGIPEGGRVLCYLGRLHHMKRPLETIKAVLASKEDIHLIVVGPDDSLSRDTLLAYLDKEKMRHRIHVIGPVYGDSKYNLLRACDCYISLSYRENFNYSAVEAMAVGLPVILSPGNDLQGEIMNVNCGWMLEALDEAHVIEVLRVFAKVSDEELRRRGRNGSVWVDDCLSFQLFQDKLRALSAQL